MSQNVTLTAKDQADIERIKPMLLQRKTQLDISRALKLRRETINRKIQRWIQTRDFEVWLKQAWLEKYQSVDDKTAFIALTQLLGKTITQKIEAKEEYIETVTHTINMNYSEEEKLAIVNARRIIRDKESRATKPNSLH